jgi:hypothetical protein
MTSFKQLVKAEIISQKFFASPVTMHKEL